MTGGDRNPAVEPLPRGGWAGAFGAAFCSSKTPQPGGVFLILGHGWRVLLLSLRALAGGGSGSAHLAAWLWLAQGTSGWADVGARQGGCQQLRVSISFFSPCPCCGLQVTPAPSGLLWGGKEGTHASPVPSRCGAGVAP